MKGINWGTLTFKKKCALPNESKLHIVQLHVVQKYMDIATVFDKIDLGEDCSNK